MRESLIEKKVCRAAKSSGWTVHPKAAIGTRGWPDRTFSKVCNDQIGLIFIEFKAPGKKPTKLQDHIIAKLRALGHEVYVIDSIETGAALFA
jgi:hypothetical protein